MYITQEEIAKLIMSHEFREIIKQEQERAKVKHEENIKEKKTPVAVYMRVGRKEQLGKSQTEKIKEVVSKMEERLIDFYVQGRIDEDELEEYTSRVYEICEDEMKKCAARIANKLGGNING